MKSFIKRYFPRLFDFVKGVKERYYLYLGKHYPERLIARLYREHYGREIDLVEPKSVDEKVNYMKLYADTSLWSRCADKFRVREYVAERGLAHTLNQVYGVYDCAEDIPFDRLPEQYVVKTTNGGGGNSVLIVKEGAQLDRADAVCRLNRWLRMPIGYKYAEYHYNAIKPRLIVEKYLHDNANSSSLVDYKFHCFDGKVHSIFVCSDRKFGESVCYSVYDLEWRLYPEKMKAQYRTEKPFEAPKSLDKMVEYSRILSQGVPYVRVDWYEVDGEPVFGEMTFTPAGGFQSFFSSEYLLELGEQMDISDIIKKREQ